MRLFFVAGGQSIGVSALASTLPMNTQDWSPLEWTGWISLKSKGLSRVFSKTTAQEDQYFSASVHFSSLAQSCSTHWPHKSQHTRPPCPSTTPGVHPNSCPSSCWCFVPCRPLLLLSLIFPSIRVFSNESVIHIRWPKCWSFNFNISPSNEYSGLISFKIDWFWSPCSPRDSQESSPTPHFKSINSLALSLLHSPTLTSLHNHRKNHSLD